MFQVVCASICSSCVVWNCAPAGSSCLLSHSATRVRRNVGHRDISLGLSCFLQRGTSVTLRIFALVLLLESEHIGRTGAQHWLANLHTMEQLLLQSVIGFRQSVVVDSVRGQRRVMHMSTHSQTYVRPCGRKPGSQDSRRPHHTQGAQLQGSGGARTLAQGQKKPLIAATTAKRRTRLPAAQLALCVPVSVAQQEGPQTQR